MVRSSPTAMWRLASAMSTSRAAASRRNLGSSVIFGRGEASARFGATAYRLEPLRMGSLSGMAQRAYSSAVPDVGGAGQVDGTSVPDVHQSVTPSEPIFETLVELAPTWGEGDLVAAGLGSYYSPVGLLEHVVDYLHVTAGLPWWAAIAVSSVAIRTTLLPLLLKSMRNGVVISNLKPEVDQLQAKAVELHKQNRSSEAQLVTHKMMNLWKKNDAHPLKSLIVPAVQIPLFISFFFAVRSLCELPVPTMTTGGMLWFSDLTLSDPYYILPVFSAATMVLSAELGAEGVPPSQSGTFKWIIRGVAGLSIPFTGSFPAGVFMYWTSSNVYSLIQMQVFKMPAIRKKFNIPKRIEHKQPSTKSKPMSISGFMDDVKKGYQSAVGKEEEKKKLHTHKPPLRQKSK